MPPHPHLSPFHKTLTKDCALDTDQTEASLHSYCHQIIPVFMYLQPPATIIVFLSPIKLNHLMKGGTFLLVNVVKLKTTIHAK